MTPKLAKSPLDMNLQELINGHISVDTITIMIQTKNTCYKQKHAILSENVNNISTLRVIKLTDKYTEVILLMIEKVVKLGKG